MRLICPNCGAQYQVDADVIPEAGRDVQCSNCGHTWFERPGASEAAEEGFGAMEALSEPNDDMPDAAAQAPSFDDVAEDDAQMPFERKPLDSSVADILKEEAERETAARAADFASTPKVETPMTAPAAAAARSVADTIADMGDDAADAKAEAEAKAAAMKAEAEEQAAKAEQEAARLKAEAEEAAAQAQAEAAEKAAAMKAAAEAEAEEAQAALAAKTASVEDETRSRIARLRGEEEAAAASRKEQLPDIEEINSTLRSSADREEIANDGPIIEEPPKKGGFKFGFILGLLLIVALILLYIFADQIIAAVPALDGAISAYVGMVDNLRLWLDDKMRGMVDTIEPADTTADS